ncbi:hypothetical protein ACP70R_006394 [Stipagrostis hirtigluma subsp. patula]
MPHSGGAVGPERCVGVDEVHDLKKEDGVHGDSEIKSEIPAMEDPGRECLKNSCSTSEAAQENAAVDECKLQEPIEIVPPKKTSPPVKWRCAICPVEATSEGNLQQHFAGQKHRSTVIALKAKAKAKAEKSRKAMKYADKSHPTWVCKFCQANCTCKSDLENHLKGKRHQAKIQALLEESKSMAGNYVSRDADLHPNIVLQDEKKLAPIWNCNICQVPLSTSHRESPSRQETPDEFAGPARRSHASSKYFATDR